MEHSKRSGKGAMPDVPRGWLRNAAGIFSLNNSDRYCGSYIAIEDAARIFQVMPSDLKHIQSVRNGDRTYLSDQKLGRAWASGSIRSPRGDFRRGGATVSFDELLIMTIIEDTLPGSLIEPQVRAGAKLADFRVTYDGRVVIVEFFGPYHFIRRTLGQTITDPRETAKYISEHLSQECIIWPYWIQRCAINVRALFDPSVMGIGSIWSTSAQFGDFFIRDSATMIKTLNSRFRIEREDGVGYMYTDELVAKPVHPIVRRIKQGRDQFAKLIPPGADEDVRYWLPRSLWPLIHLRA